MLQLRELGRSLADCLVEIWTEMWPTVSELEVLDLPWVLLEGKDSGVGAWKVRMDFCHLRPLTHTDWEVYASRRQTFHRNCEEQVCRGALASLCDELCDCCSLWARPYGEGCSHLGNLSTMGVTGSQGSGARRWHSTAKGKVGTKYPGETGSRVRTAIRTV